MTKLGAITGLHKVLFLEDDADLRSEILECLQEDFDIVGCTSVSAFWQEFRRHKPSIVMLDLGLPDGRGTDVIRDLRDKDRNLGILVLSGRMEEADRIISLEFGADDYLTKPCSPREMVARINALLRRVCPDDPVRVARSVAYFESFRLDLMSMQLTNPDREQISLTTAEFALLKVFVENAQRVLSRDRLTSLLRGNDWSGYDRSIDGLIYRLRKKFRDFEDGNSILRTVHGSGYMFAPVVRFQDFGQ